ncbi:hypothetical protein [Leptolyngbya phage Lbo240-yong1]|uniref:Uncharacterized protein n=1 Tax=Leptolyngbya phage Lbo240-yong1 TaxID=2928836 RepID=A0A9X9H2U5_9CAUD|nr:hypothetical protein [Leptolyngbya phage Lbo240-yong1]
MTTKFTVSKATHNHTRFTVIREREGKSPDTLNVSYGKKGMTIKANGEKVKGSLAKSTLWQACHNAVAEYLEANSVAIGSPTVKAAKPAKTAKLDKPAKRFAYRELQAVLKAAKAQGFDVDVRLNSKYDVLEAEYDRLTNLKGKAKLVVGNFTQLAALAA